MSASANIEPKGQEHTTVAQLVNCFVAIYVKGKNKRFISKHPETELKVAEATARLFAEKNHIPYLEMVCTISPSIITVFKRDEEWYPAELHPDKITLLTQFGPIKLGGTLKETTNIAKVIALSRGADCIPSIGISLAK